MGLNDEGFVDGKRESASGEGERFDVWIPVVYPVVGWLVGK
jgi:hypothetical protein